MLRALPVLVVALAVIAGAPCLAAEGNGTSAPPPGVDQASGGTTPAEPDLNAQKAVLADAQKLLGKKDYAGLRAALTPLTHSGVPEIAYPAMFWIARSHYAEKADDTAIPLFERAASSYKPIAGQAHYWLGQIYVRKRWYATARDCFRHGVACGDEGFSDDCMYYVGYTRYLDRHYELAVKAFTEFLKTYPKSSLAKSAEKLLEQSRTKLQAARKVTLDWAANLGIASNLEQAVLGQSEFGLGADARLGGSMRWEPRDGVRVSANAYGTRTSYIAGDLGDRQGLVAGLSMSQDLGDTRSLGYGLSYSENQRLDISSSDSRTQGAWVSLRMPLRDSASVSVYLNASDLEYVSEASSGTQYTVSGSFSSGLSNSTSLSLGANYTSSSVGAEYLSYDSPGVSLGLNRRLSKRRTARAGLSYTARNFDAPRPRQDVARTDRQRTFYTEYSQKITDRITVTVGWRETSRSSNDSRLSGSDPSWYLRTSSLFDIKF